MRPSELLASRKKDLVPLPLLPCWSVVIAGARIQRVLGFRTLQDVQKRGQWRAFSSAARYGRSSRLAAECHSLSLTLRCKLETRATCRGIVGRTGVTASSHRRMTDTYMLDVFGGSGFLEKTSDHLVLRGYVLRSEVWVQVRRDEFPLFSPKFDDVSAGKSVGGMISLPLQHTSCSHKVLLASTAIANSLRRARMTRIVEHPRESWLWDVRKIQALATQLRAACRFQCFWITMQISERRFWLEKWTAGICTVSHEGVLEQVDTAVCQDKHVHSNACGFAFRDLFFT